MKKLLQKLFNTKIAKNATVQMYEFRNNEFRRGYKYAIYQMASKNADKEVAEKHRNEYIKASKASDVSEDSLCKSIAQALRKEPNALSYFLNVTTK